MISTGAPFALTSAPRSLITHVDEGGWTLCGTRIGDGWAGQYNEAPPSGMPTCKRCSHRVAALPAAAIDAPVRPDVTPVVFDWDSAIRHAVVTVLTSDSAGNYNAVTGERDDRDGRGYSALAVTYCGTRSYGVSYGAGDGPSVDCAECRSFPLYSAGAHADMVTAWKDSERRAAEVERQEVEEQWKETVAYYRARGLTFVPEDASQPRGWGDWVALVDQDHADALDENERRTVCALVLANMDRDERARSMAAHPAGKARGMSARTDFRSTDWSGQPVYVLPGAVVPLVDGYANLRSLNGRGYAL